MVRLNLEPRVQYHVTIYSKMLVCRFHSSPKSDMIEWLVDVSTWGKTDLFFLTDLIITHTHTCGRPHDYSTSPVTMVASRTKVVPKGIEEQILERVRKSAQNSRPSRVVQNFFVSGGGCDTKTYHKWRKSRAPFLEGLRRGSYASDTFTKDCTTWSREKRCKKESQSSTP